MSEDSEIYILIVFWFSVGLVYGCIIGSQCF